MAVTIANMIGIRLLPLPKWSHFWNVLSSSGRHHISPTGLTFAIGSHFFLNWTCNSFHKLSVKWWSLLLLDNFLGIGVSPSHHPFYSCSSFQSPENTRDNQQNLKKKKNYRPDLHQLFSCQTSDWCKSVRKSKLQFSGHTFIYKQSVGDLTLTQFLKHVIIPQKRQVFHYIYSKTPHWRFQKIGAVVATQAPEFGQTSGEGVCIWKGWWCLSSRLGVQFRILVSLKVFRAKHHHI